MKNLVKEVIFPAYGDWKIEAYAWSKELARRLNASFRVLQNGKTTNEEFAHQILRGDGYYFSHYHHTPLKTHLTSIGGELNPDFINYLKDSSGLAVIMLDLPSHSNTQYITLNLSNHVILSIPNPIEKKSKETEFLDILRQISILNLPFDFAKEDKPSWFSKLFHSLRAFL